MRLWSAAVRLYIARLGHTIDHFTIYGKIPLESLLVSIGPGC